MTLLIMAICQAGEPIRQDSEEFCTRIVISG